MSGKILITGGVGYVGYRLAKRLLETTDSSLVLWMRARSEDELRAKSERWRKAFEPHADRVELAGGDLTQADPFAGVRPEEIRTILHSAANTRFNLDAETADRVNVQGTVRVIELARRCRSLESLSLISTVYASGLRRGLIPEATVDRGPGFANHYERSKWESEQQVVESGLPFRIFRTATLIADDESGVVSQINVFHKVLRLMYVGLLPIFPGLGQIPMYLLTGEFMANAIAELLPKAPLGSVLNVCHRREESITLAEWLTLSYDYFREDPAFASKRFMRPMFTDLKAFRFLAESVSTFSRDVVTQAVVELVSPFAEQMFVEKDIDNTLVRSLVTDYRAPDMKALLRRVAHYLAATNWGLQPPPNGTAPVHRWEA